MKIRNTPAINRRYWIAITLASVFGANLGDFCSHVLGLGHLRGLPVLAVMFALILLGERRSRTSVEAFYWAAIVTLRTAATNLADLATHDLKIPYLEFILCLALLLGGLALSRRRSFDATGGAPNTDALYWTAMLIAGTLGTALADFCADLEGLGVSTLVWAIIWAMGLAFVVSAGSSRAVSYWPMIVVIRTFGTNLGDGLAGRRGLALGLLLSTAVSGFAFIALLAAVRNDEHGNAQ